MFAANPVLLLALYESFGVPSNSHMRGQLGEELLRWVSGVGLSCPALQTSVRDPRGTFPVSGHALGIIIIIIIMPLAGGSSGTAPAPGGSQLPVPTSMQGLRPNPHHHFHTEKLQNAPSVTPVWEKHQPRHPFQVLTIYK